MALPYQTVKIDGKLYPLVANTRPNETAIGAFAPKITIGDYTVDSNDILSAWSIRDLTGGHGIDDHTEGVTDNRYNIGTLYTRRPGKWSKPFRITRNVLNAGVGNMRPLGDMYHSGSWHHYLEANTALWQDTTSKGSLGVATVNRAVPFKGLGALSYLYIPLGSGGYATYEPVGNTLTTTSGAEKIVAFLKWNDKLVIIDTVGQMSYATTAAAVTTFTSYGTSGAKLDESYTPKNLLSYFNRSGERSIFIVTDQSLWVFDPATPQLYEVPEIDGVHPYFGIASETWNSNLYIAAGMDVIEFNGSVGRNIGLSRDDGLPGDTGAYTVGRNPRIIDLVASQNALYALVRGTDSSNNVTSVHEYSGFGWCMLESRTLTNPPIGLSTSRADSIYRIIWGGGDGIISWQTLPFAFFNPSAVASTSFGYAAGSGVSGFASNYAMRTGYFDGGMPAYRKIANALRIDWIDNDADGLTVSYRVDDATSFTAFSTIPTSDADKIFKFGTQDAQGIFTGLPFYKIELQIGLAENGNNPTTTPIIKSAVMSFLKINNPSWSWTATVDMENTFEDRSPENMFEELVALKDSDRFFAFQFQDKTTPEIFTTRIAGMNDVASVGLDQRRQVQLNIIEIRTQLGIPVADEIVG